VLLWLILYCLSVLVLRSRCHFSDVCPVRFASAHVCGCDCAGRPCGKGGARLSVGTFGPSSRAICGYLLTYLLTYSWPA
jgi:hypothetical protein